MAEETILITSVCHQNSENFHSMKTEEHRRESSQTKLTVEYMSKTGQ